MRHGLQVNTRQMSAAETARMIPQLSAATVRQAMRWAGDERRLAEASGAVFAYMRQHPIAATWGRSDLASSDMMSLETQRRSGAIPPESIARCAPTRTEGLNMRGIFQFPSSNMLTP
jgi:hypothetical protein